MGNTGSFLDNLEWRRATKRFGDARVDTEPIVRAMTNAPSSFGLQPYTILAVHNPEIRKKLREVSFGQAQVTQCQTLFILCARTDVKERAEEYLAATGAEGLRGMLTGFLAAQPDLTAWAARQAYIALGFGLAAAAELRIASCPMEGFMPGEVSKILGLPETLQPVVYLAVGDESDEEEEHPRFRFPRENLVREFH